MISRWIPGLFALTLLLPAPVLAGPKAVVELFTSQGCSSCPPADALLVEFSRRPDLVALTLPVDYWDYLGWKDTLAHSAFSARQRGYAHRRGDRQVYTPQVVVNGAKPCVGSEREQIEALIGASPGGASLPVEVTATERDGIVTIEVAADSARAERAEIWVLPVLRSQSVQIGRGENGGRSVTYSNVVRALHRVGEWTGEAARVEVPLATARGEADGYVILLQAGGKKPGPILGAAKSAGL